MDNRLGSQQLEDVSVEAAHSHRQLLPALSVALQQPPATQ